MVFAGRVIAIRLHNISSQWDAPSEFIHTHTHTDSHIVHQHSVGVKPNAVLLHFVVIIINFSSASVFFAAIAPKFPLDDQKSLNLSVCLSVSKCRIHYPYVVHIYREYIADILDDSLLDR